VDPDLRRLEELTLNSSAPPGQLLFDGWLIRLAPGKAKRARSVNALYPSTRPLGEKIAHCEQVYAQAGLPAVFRLTPLTEPALEAALAERGYTRLEPTAVEAASIESRAFEDQGARDVALGPWVEAVGSLRASPADHRVSHRARLESLPLEKHAMVLEAGGRVVCAGLVVLEGEDAGLFDVVTDEAERRKGHARRLVTTLLHRARARGARRAYLQVECDNVAARRLYADLGFSERYRYWYRVPP
jgi:ribosomal protein S18 acetylase RimI-like enzyme